MKHSALKAQFLDILMPICAFVQHVVFIPVKDPLTRQGITAKGQSIHNKGIEPFLMSLNEI